MVSGTWRTYRVGLWLVEPAVSGAEQVQGHLRVVPHLQQAGQRLTHLRDGDVGPWPCRVVPTQSQSATSQLQAGLGCHHLQGCRDRGHLR